MAEGHAEPDSEDVRLGRIGQLAAGLMESLEEEIAEEDGPAPTVGEVAVVVELDWPAEAVPPAGSTRVFARSTNPRGWVTRGLLLEAVKDSLSNEQPGEEPDED